MRRTIFAVIVGFAVTSVLALSGDFAIRALFPSAFPSAGPAAAGPLLVSLVYSAIGGGHRWSGRGPPNAGQEHRTGLDLGMVMLVMGIVAALARAASAPAWYHVVSLVLVVPVTVAGASWRGRMRVRAATTV